MENLSYLNRALRGFELLKALDKLSWRSKIKCQREETLENKQKSLIWLTKQITLDKSVWKIKIKVL